MAQFKALTNEELSKIVPILLQVLLTTNSDTRLYSTDIVRIMSVMLSNKKINYNFTQVNLRRMINYLRSIGKLPIMAGPRGYWVSTSKEEILAQVESLESRAASIMQAASGLRKFLI